jgi:hypothetical protein
MGAVAFDRTVRRSAQLEPAALADFAQWGIDRLCGSRHDAAKFGRSRVRIGLSKVH